VYAKPQSLERGDSRKGKSKKEKPKKIYPKATHRDFVICVSFSIDIEEIIYLLLKMPYLHCESEARRAQSPISWHTEVMASV